MIRIIYDGACPFCVNYVRYTRLRDRLGEIDLRDGRAEPELVEDYARHGFEIDESFIVDTGSEVLTHGAAMAFVHGQLAPAWSGLPLLAQPKLLEAVYPGLRAIRNASLKVLGVRPIRHGAPTAEAPAAPSGTPHKDH